MAGDGGYQSFLCAFTRTSRPFVSISNLNPCIFADGVKHLRVINSIQRRAIYKLVDPDTDVRKYQIITGFYEAVSLAQGAIQTPRQDIFEKYFRPSDRETVSQVFAKIVDGDPESGAPQFANISVVFRDPQHICQTNTGRAIGFLPGPPVTIVLCPPFWEQNGGNLASRPCRILGKSVSLLMETVSSLILRQLLWVFAIILPNISDGD